MTESSLHFAIKNWYTIAGDEIEANVKDFIVDILRDRLVIEIQTGNFSAVKKKLFKMVLSNPVRLVYPIAQVKWLVNLSSSGEVVGRRKSPKRGKLADLFYELVHLPRLIKDRNFSLEVLLIEMEELRCSDGRGSWTRRGVSIWDRKLLNVFDRVVFEENRDFLRFLPKKMDEYFTNKILSHELGVSIRLAQKITYCLNKMGAISVSGRKRNELLFRIS